MNHEFPHDVKLNGDFHLLHKQLIEPGHQISELMKVANYFVPESQTEEFYTQFIDSGLEHFLVDKKNPEQQFFYPTDMPEDICITAEEYDYADNPTRELLYGDLRSGLILNFNYSTMRNNDLISVYDWRLRLRAVGYTRPSVTTRIFDHGYDLYSGGGYEGHYIRQQHPNTQEYKALLDIFSKAKEIPVQKSHWRMNGDTAEFVDEDGTVRKLEFRQGE